MSTVAQSTKVCVAVSCGTSHIVLVCFDGTPGGEVWLQLHLRPRHFVAGESYNRMLGAPVSMAGRCACNDAECQQVSFLSWLVHDVAAKLDMNHEALSDLAKEVHRAVAFAGKAQYV